MAITVSAAIFPLVLTLSLASQWSPLDKQDRVWVEKYVQDFDVNSWARDLDADKDGAITFKEYLQGISKADVDDDGEVLMCEFLPYFWKHYMLDPYVGQFLFTDKDGHACYDEWFVSVGRNSSIKVEKFKALSIQWIRRTANTAYEAINGPVREDKQNPEIPHRNTLRVVKLLDKESKGYLLPSDIEKLPEDRCTFVQTHVAVYGGTRWFFNHAFTYIDVDRDGLYGPNELQKLFAQADRDLDGKQTVEEVASRVNALLRSTRLLAGVDVKFPWTCPDLVVPASSMALQYALDADLDQHGEIEPWEMLQFFWRVDDNGDKLIQMREWVDRLVKRYGIPSDLALALFDEQDVNNDGIFDFRTESPWFSVDNNLDGKISMCEFLGAILQWLDIGARNKGKLEQCLASGENGCYEKEMWLDHFRP